MKYKTSITKIEQVAEGTLAMHFHKPAGFTFQAGQFVDITLLDPKYRDTAGSTRSFSLASAPEDSDLMIVTRIRDTAFKKSIAAAEVGHPLEFEGPWGSFGLLEVTGTPLVFLAGGIGVTPFHSMIKHAIYSKRAQPIYLFCSNRRPEDSVFLTEFSQLEKENADFKFVPTMTAMDKSEAAWQGEVGYIDSAILERYLPGGATPTYYISGPLGFVVAMRKLLMVKGLTDEYIKTEEFSGY